MFPPRDDLISFGFSCKNKKRPLNKNTINQTTTKTYLWPSCFHSKTSFFYLTHCIMITVELKLKKYSVSLSLGGFNESTVQSKNLHTKTSRKTFFVLSRFTPIKSDTKNSCVIFLVTPGRLERPFRTQKYVSQSNRIINPFQTMGPNNQV